MKREIIAEVKLASGEVGYYDDYSKLYLTINKPYGVIYSGTNLTQIKRSIKSGRLKLISGKLFDADKKPVVEVTPEVKPEEPVKNEDHEEKPVQEEIAPVENTEVVEEVKEEIPAEVTEVENEVNEVNEVVNEVTEEEKPVKKSRKRTVKTEE